MPDTHSLPHITGVDYTSDIVIVNFAGGMSVTFDAQFLFLSREENDNHVIGSETLPSHTPAVHPDPES